MMPERFHSGWNVVPFSPTEEPACHAEWPDAAQSLMELMRQWADEDDAAALEEVDWDLISPEREQAWFESDEAPSMLAHVRAIFRDDGPRTPGENYLTILEDHQQRRIGFWLIKVMCEDPIHLAESEE